MALYFARHFICSWNKQTFFNRIFSIKNIISLSRINISVDINHNDSQTSSENDVEFDSENDLDVFNQESFKKILGQMTDMRDVMEDHAKINIEEVQKQQRNSYAKIHRTLSNS